MADDPRLVNVASVVACRGLADLESLGMAGSNRQQNQPDGYQGHHRSLYERVHGDACCAGMHAIQ